MKTVRREALGVRGGLRGVVAVLAFCASLLTPYASPAWAGCDHHYLALTGSEVPVDCNGSIHATTSDYYRGAIYTFDHGAGICRVTAYLKFTGGVDDWDGYTYTAKIWSLSGDNLATLLGTSTDSYLGGNWTNHDDNWTATKKIFHFYWPVKVPAGRVAITISDAAASAHPDNYHSWCRSGPKAGQEACSWTGSYEGTCTTEYSQAMEIDYVETPFLTAQPNGDYRRIGAPPYIFYISYYGKPRGWIEIPEWKQFGADLCEMDDNVTVACEIPSAVMSKPGNYNIRARFRPPNDNNASHFSRWSDLFRFRVDSSSPTITQHPSGATSATITGVYR